MKRILIITAVLLTIVYVGDYVSVRYKIPNSRNSYGYVTISRYYAVKLKSGKREIYFDSSADQVCVRSLFPHLDCKPCWYLNLIRDERMNIGQIESWKHRV